MLAAATFHAESSGFAVGSRLQLADQLRLWLRLTGGESESEVEREKK